MEDLYPTRGNQQTIRDRRDPVVCGTTEPGNPYALSAERLAGYEKEGFVVIPDVFSGDEVDAMLQEYERLEAADDLQGRDELVREPGSEEVRSIFNPHRLSVLFDRVSRDRRILDKVTQILGSGVYIHHGRINIKRALDGRSFPWHSDFETWHAEDGLPRMRVLSGWVMLTENTPFNGPLFLVPGSHKRFIGCAGATPESHHKESLRRQEYGVPDLKALRTLADREGIVGVFGEPGTLVLHEGNVLHGSPDNITPWSRTNLFFVYNSVHNKPATKPFAAERFRPEFLASRDFAPVRAVDDAFAATAPGSV